MAHPFARFVGELFPQLPCELFDIPETFTPLTPAGIAPFGADVIMGSCPIYIFAEPTPTQAGRDKPLANRFEDVVNLGIDTSGSHALARRSTVASSITSAPASASPARRSAMRPETRSAAAIRAASSL